MSRSVVGAWLVLVAGLVISSRAFGASVADLPKDESQAALCMASALDSIPEARRARIQISDSGGRHVFLEYDFKHHWREWGVSHERVDITEIVSHPDREHGMALGGLFAPGKITVDDADSGMPRITELWRSKCGLKLWAMLV